MMKARLHTLIFLIITTLLSACVTKKTLQQADTDTIRAILLKEHRLYAIGDKSDYLFEGRSVIELKNLLQSKYYSSIQQTSATLEVYKNRLTAYINIHLAKPNLPQEKDELGYYYNFRPASPLNSSQNENQLHNQYVLQGTFLNLENKQEILQKYPLEYPMIISIKYYTLEKNVAKDILILPFFPIWIFGLKV